MKDIEKKYTGIAVGTAPYEVRIQALEYANDYSLLDDAPKNLRASYIHLKMLTRVVLNDLFE